MVRLSSVVFRIFFNGEIRTAAYILLSRGAPWGALFLLQPRLATITTVSPHGLWYIIRAQTKSPALYLEHVILSKQFRFLDFLNIFKWSKYM